MSDLSTASPTTTTPTNKGSAIKTKSTINSKVSTMMVKFTKVHNTSVKMSIDFSI